MENKAKKKMKNRTFLAIWVPCLTVAAAVTIALPIVANHFGSVLDTYVGHGDIIKTPASGTENWDKTYYTSETANQIDSATASQEKTKQICEEGFVLLKNKNNNSLPIAKGSTITMLGTGSVNPIYGGSGSGSIGSKAVHTPKEGLEAAGFTVNQGAYDFFKDNYASYPRGAVGFDNVDNGTFFIGEIPASKYSFAPEASDVALVFITRAGGEGGDLSSNLKRDLSTSASQKLLGSNAAAAAEAATYSDDEHQLELDKDEKDMVAFAEAHYAKTVVVVNSSNAMELGDLQNDDGVDGILWVGGPGSTGFYALGEILDGSVNPSGRTADIYPSDFTKDPTFQNFAYNGLNQYNGMDTTNTAGGNYSDHNNGGAYFVEYEEGIYVGYRYYETRFGGDETAYSSAVVYPFGYGLSYSSFTESIVSHSDPSILGTECSITVKVKNTGTIAGKDTVEIYYTAPYLTGGIQKSSANLVAFAKTDLIAAGGEQTITLSWDQSDMASYDYKINKCYVLDSGSYTISLRENSHKVVDSYSFSLSGVDYVDGRPGDAQAPTNQFDDVSAMFTDKATAGYATNMSRDDFAGTFPTTPTTADCDPSTVINGKTIKERLAYYDVTKHNNAADVAPKMGETNGLTLIDMRGLDYDDPAWDMFLNQLTDSDYTNSANYIDDNCYKTLAIDSLGKPLTDDRDGPAGWASPFGGADTAANNCAWMSEVVLASTWNVNLANDMGLLFGNEGLTSGSPSISGWYGPAMDTHRSPFAGRNFEYYSEDGLLSGKMAANVVSGAAQKGVYATIKHFAFNDQEYMRDGNLCTWINEQAIREIYLKPFEICVKEAKANLKYISDSKGTISTKEVKGCTGVMVALERIGCTWVGGSEPLCTEVLRNEWGFRGVCISDFNLYDSMNVDEGMRGGCDTQLTMLAIKGGFADTSSATARIAIRKAIKNLCYTVANCNAMNGIAPGTIITYTMAPWEKLVVTATTILGAGVVAGATWCVVRCLKHSKKKEDVASTK